MQKWLRPVLPATLAEWACLVLQREARFFPEQPATVPLLAFVAEPTVATLYDIGHQSMCDVSALAHVHV